MNKSFFDKDSYTFKDLENLIENDIEESLNLDYKSARSLDKADGKKRELAKDVSAFANSDGGIIIYGIEELDHKPTEFSFVDGDTLTKEWLENVIDSNIQPKIQNLEIHPIRLSGKLEKTIYVLKIPESPNAPHMSADKKYYRRYNFKSVPMEEYEIRNLYSRNTLAEIDFESVLTRKLETEKIEGIPRTKFELFIHLINVSDVLEKHCKIEASFKNVEDMGVGVSYYQQSKIGQIIKKDSMSFKAYNDSPIFPDEKFVIMRLEINLYKSKLRDFKESAILELKLFDSCSIKSTEYKMYDLINLDVYEK